MARLGGCGPTTAGSPEAEAPRLADLNSERQWTSPGIGIPQTGPAFSDYQLQIYTVQVPLNNPRTGLAAGLLDPAPFPWALRQNWEQEGFALGRLPRERLGFFMANLPLQRWTETQEFRQIWRYEPLSLGAGPRAAHTVALHDPQPRDLRMGPGEYRFLARFIEALPTDGTPLRLELVPHHYRPRIELVPRTPDERQLDGQIFEHLAIKEPMDVNELWVLRLGSPEPVTGEEAGPIRLADAMLRGQKQGQVIQTILLIGLARREDLRPPTKEEGVR